VFESDLSVAYIRHIESVSAGASPPKTMGSSLKGWEIQFSCTTLSTVVTLRKRPTVAGKNRASFSVHSGQRLVISQ